MTLTEVFLVVVFAAGLVTGLQFMIAGGGEPFEVDDDDLDHCTR